MSSSETPLLPRLYTRGKIDQKEGLFHYCNSHKWPKELLNGADLCESSMLQERLLICIVAHKLPKELCG